MRTKDDSSKRVGIWIRVSKLADRRRPNEKSESPEYHRLRARMAAEERGWTVVEEYDLSDVSGKDVWHHPEAKRMLADVRRGHIQALIFSKLARLGRKTEALIRFQQVFDEYGADLVALDQPIDTTTAAGRNYFRHKASDAEWEREEASERMRDSVQMRAALGKQLSGSSPFGYHWVDGTLVPHPEEAPVRLLMYELYAQHRRKRTVARLLNEAGYRTRKGGLWTPLGVDRLIRDPTAKGMHRRNYTTRAPDNRATLFKPESEWEFTDVQPIVPEPLWEQCNQILAANRQPQQRPAKRAVQLFAGVVFCGRCSGKMYVPSRTTKYVCQTCRTKIPRDDLERIFREQFRAFFLSPEAVARHVEEGNEELGKRVALLDQLSREQAKTAREMEKTYRLYLDDALSAEGFRKLYRPLEERAGQLNDEIPRLQAEVDFLRIQATSREEIAAEGISLFDRWDELDLETKRRYVEGLVRRIVVSEDEIDIELASLPPPVEHVANGAHTPRAFRRCCSGFTRPSRGRPTRTFAPCGRTRRDLSCTTELYG